MKKGILLLFLLHVFYLTNAQQHLFLGFSGEYGLFTRSFNENRNVLRTRSLGSIVAGNISLQYRIFNRLTFEAGGGFTRQRWALKDKDFEKRYPGFEVNIKNKNAFNTLFFGIQYAQPLNPKTYLFFQATGVFNLVGKTSLSDSSKFVLGNEDVVVRTYYSDNFYSLMPEVGLQWFTKRNKLITLSLKYNQAMSGHLLQGDYEIKNNGTVIKQDAFTADGSYLTLNFKYNFLLSYKPKREKPVKQKEIKEEPQKPVVKTEKPKTDQNVAGRDYYVTNKVRVKQKTVTIKVWDHGQEDGDIISLNLNGQWVIENYTLTKAKKEFKVTLKDGENHLVLHALNLGKYKPNTASISVYDGDKEQVVVLESNLEASGAVEINVKP